jgi:hypothetical protein
MKRCGRAICSLKAPREVIFSLTCNLEAQGYTRSEAIRRLIREIKV